MPAERMSGSLTAEQIAVLRELLLQRRAEILAEATKTVGGLNANTVNTPDPSDRASIEADHIALLRVRDRERKLLSKIDEALGRIESGEYGYCESCDAPIGFNRLRVRPVTTFCVNCKAEQEELERRPGHS
ncbi:MAG: RNA polymerase-binding protein DksA [Candidatus Binatia bacterium]|nr:RNA polymerase-binding protein DksA [Candidatus Binatia bacterium]